jgi:hypothetical protein
MPIMESKVLYLVKQDDNLLAVAHSYEEALEWASGLEGEWCIDVMVTV